MKVMDSASSGLLGVGIGLFVFSLSLKNYYFFNAEYKLFLFQLCSAFLITSLSALMFLGSNQRPTYNIGYGIIVLIVAILMTFLQIDALKNGFYNYITVLVGFSAILVLLLCAGLQLKR